MSDPNITPVNENEEKAGCLGLGFSFFFPIVGIILYFCNKKYSNASSYLVAAGAGFGVGLLLRILASAM